MLSNFNPRRNQANLEASRRRLLEATYTAPLGIDAVGNGKNDDADMHALRSFLGEFYRNFYDKSSVAKRQEVLDEYAELASFYDRVVKGGTVSEEEFWQRYYYRCDPDQILLEWERHPERGRQIMGQAVTSWFKNAVSVGDSSTGLGGGFNSINSSKSTTPWNSVKNAWVMPREEKDVGSKSMSKDSTNRKLEKRSDKSGNIISDKSSSATGNSTPSSSVYVPPHKRGKVKVVEKSNQMGIKPDQNSRISSIIRNNSKGTSNFKMNTRASGLLNNSHGSNGQNDRHNNGHETRSENDAALSERGRFSTMAANTQYIGVSKTLFRNISVTSIIGALLLCWLVAAFLTVLSRREQVCASSNPFWSPLLLCLDDPPPMDQLAVKIKSGSNKRGKLQRNGVYSSGEGYINDNLGGQPGADVNNSGDSLVDNLISSWTQSTDMAQFLGGNKAEQQQELQMQQQPYQSNNGIAMLSYEQEQEEPRKKKKKGGPFQFLKRKFGRDRITSNAENALVVIGNNNNYNNEGGYGSLSKQQSNQPRMVVHQHVHHVVHHVVHEYRE